jgi:hypothetical protein
MSDMMSSDSIQLGDKYKERWEDCAIGFFCPRCGTGHVGESQMGPEVCKCGVRYQLVAHIKFSSAETCPRCGTKIEEVIWGKTNCPNCGLHFECC